MKYIDRYDKVLISDIFHIESQKNYIHVHTKGTVYKHRTTLREFKTLLHNNFFKVHRAFIVNLELIESFNKNDSTIKLCTGNVPLSKTYRALFLDKLLTNS